ncbi:MAG: hypothetical protein K0R73_788 [Candidatus Midichloriaceae bacterium]|nr:hypothetical protein [Candidatus Midichloriaceae bacterium]
MVFVDISFEDNFEVNDMKSLTKDEIKSLDPWHQERVEQYRHDWQTLDYLKQFSWGQILEASGNHFKCYYREIEHPVMKIMPIVDEIFFVKRSGPYKQYCTPSEAIYFYNVEKALACTGTVLGTVCGLVLFRATSNPLYLGTVAVCSVLTYKAATWKVPPHKYDQSTLTEIMEKAVKANPEKYNNNEGENTHAR